MAAVFALVDAKLNVFRFANLLGLLFVREPEPAVVLLICVCRMLLFFLNIFCYF